jgi:hypothetical protein
MHQFRKQWLWVALGVGALMLLGVLLAPSQGQLLSGSTYSRGPDGYGAWYAQLQRQGIEVERWQRPLRDLPPQGGMTLLQVRPELRSRSASPEVRRWVQQGNTAIVLGVSTKVSDAPFVSQIVSDSGMITIATRRRQATPTALLQDRFGAVVWEEAIGPGRVVYAATPHLAANAYQDMPGNFHFLNQLVTERSHVLKVDEYLHGYRDASVAQQEGKGNVISYLVHTPLLIVGLQGLLILIVAIVATNIRFGPPQPVSAPKVDNTVAYITALAGALRQAGSYEFVQNLVGKAERLQLQRRLGLGEIPLKPEALGQAWQQHARPSSSDLPPLFQTQQQTRSSPHRLGEAALIRWLQSVQTLRDQLPSLRKSR